MRRPRCARRPDATASASTLPASLATYWLIPRLDSLEKACPGIDLELVTTARLIDLRREGVDLAIRYGGGTWPGLDVRPLLGEQIVPVCQPGFVQPAEARDPQAVLADKRLIVETDLPQRWAEWAAANGLTLPDLAGALRFSTHRPGSGGGRTRPRHRDRRARHGRRSPGGAHARRTIQRHGPIRSCAALPTGSPGQRTVSRRWRRARSRAGCRPWRRVPMPTAKHRKRPSVRTSRHGPSRKQNVRH